MILCKMNVVLKVLQEKPKSISKVTSQSASVELKLDIMSFKGM
jgi:hypothetical protein